MKMKSFRTGVAAVMGGVLLVVGLLVGASIALADDSDTTSSATEDKSVDRCRDRIHGLAGEIADELGVSLDEIKDQLRDGATLDEIAADLGIDLESVLDSVKDRVLSEIADRVAAGEIPEERAADIQERIESFDLGDGFPFRPRGFDFEEFRRGFGDMRFPGGFDLDLDIDLSELRGKLESGLALDEALEELGVDLGEALAEARAAALEKIDELVAAGTITQERADQIKEMIESFERGDGFPFGMRGFDFHELEDLDRFGGFFDGHRRGFGFFGDSADDVNAEDAGFSVWSAGGNRETGPRSRLGAASD